MPPQAQKYSSALASRSSSSTLPPSPPSASAARRLSCSRSSRRARRRCLALQTRARLPRPGRGSARRGGGASSSRSPLVLEPLQRVLAQRLEHREARSSAGAAARTRLLSTSEPSSVEARVADRPRPPRACSRPRRRRAGANSACSSASSRSWLQSIAAAQRLLALRAGRAAPPVEERQPLLQPGEQRLRREHLRPRGRELDRQRQAVERDADLGDGAAFALVSAKSGDGACGARDEQRAPPRTARARSTSAPLARLGQRERRHRVLVLAGEAQRRAARDERPSARARRRAARRRAARPSATCSKLSSTSSMRLSAQVQLAAPSTAVPPPLSADAERRARSSTGRAAGSSDGRERDEPGAVVEVAAQLARPPRARAASCRCRPAPVSVSSRTSSRREQRGDGGELELAADQRRRRSRQVGGRRGRRRRRLERRILAQDRALELLQRRSGLDAELVDERAPGDPRTPRAPRPGGPSGRARGAAGRAAARGTDALRRAPRARRSAPRAGRARARPRCAPRPRRAAPPRAVRPRRGERRREEVRERRAAPERQRLAQSPPQRLRAAPSGRRRRAAGTARGRARPGSTRRL